MNETLKIEIFGKGCKNCEKLEENVRQASREQGKPIEIIKVKDMDEIINRGVFKTPGLAINGKVVSTGRVLSPRKIAELL
jgi:small redox-active disulfide protein 2